MDKPAPVPVSPTLAVWGAGQMAGALVRGWVRTGTLLPERVRVYAPSPARLAPLAAETNVIAVAMPAEALQFNGLGADALLLAMKPHAVVPALQATPLANPSPLVISVAAGVPLRTLEAALPPQTPVLRVMPNTPALVGAGASAFCRNAHATDAHAALAHQLFGAVGVSVEVTEAQLDAVIGVSGSGVAYLYLVMEALADGGVRAGLPRAIARTLAAQTALGAAQMVLQTGEHPAVLKDAVTTPGGTTIAALHTLERAGVRGAFMDAVLAARDRAQEMGR